VKKKKKKKKIFIYSSGNPKSISGHHLELEETRSVYKYMDPQKIKYTHIS
jgi:hypothetical protein